MRAAAGSRVEPGSEKADTVVSLIAGRRGQNRSRRSDVEATRAGRVQ